MTHQPQQILVRVDCKERLPKDDKFYHVEDDYGQYSLILEEWVDLEYQTVHPDYWYEPTTAIVLTVEEYSNLKRMADMYSRQILLRK